MTLPRSCRVCGKPGGSLCAAHARRQARGYGSAYTRNRAVLVRQVLANPRIPCCICGRGFIGARLRDITAEHLIPVREGGSSELSNLAPAHARCNYGWRRNEKNT